MNVHIEVGRLLPVWQSFRDTTGIAPIRDEAHYRYMVRTLEALLDEAAGDEEHPAMGLIDIVGDLIEDYEAEHHPLPEATGVQALEFLMAQHGLTAGDLGEVGSEAVIAEVLSGKRDLNIYQLRVLSRRFGVSPATFI